MLSHLKVRYCMEIQRQQARNGQKKLDNPDDATSIFVQNSLVVLNLGHPRIQPS
jgi:hypothetical protein